ncbi:hypothetical protein GQ53DRAFT_834389 [Thozetella sp. PMI_491]|nr:hypothetical protein GQ53DRAFT_834389 [Thozetella sp. PMI_491]
MAATQPVKIRNAAILTMDAEVNNLENGVIVIQDGKILALRTNLPLPRPDAIKIHWTNHIVLSGFADCHRRALMETLRQIHSNSASLYKYLGVGNNELLEHFRPEDVDAGVYSTAFAAINASATTVIDNMHANKSPAHAAAAIKARQDAGCEALVAFKFGWEHSLPEEEIDEQLNTARAAISPDAKSRIDVAICGPFHEAEAKVAPKQGARISAEYGQMLSERSEAIPTPKISI